MYELKKVGERTYYISYRTNMGIYKINDTDVCLIDTGNDKESGKHALKIIEENGWKLTIIINTHSHADHVGGNHYLEKHTNCNIYTPGEECAYTEYTHLEPALLYGGYPYSEIRTKFFIAHESKAQKLTDEVLPEGLEILRLDGHSFAMVAIKTPDNIWFLADSLVSEKILDKSHITYLYDVKKYLTSLKTVKTLAGRLFIPSHAEPAEDIVPLADENIKQVRQILHKIKKICRKPGTTEDIIKAIFDLYDLKINFIQHTLVGCTVRSYISYLHDAGYLSAQFYDNKLYWKTTDKN